MPIFNVLVGRTLVQAREEHAVLVVEAADRSGAKRAAEALLAADIDRLPWEECKDAPFRQEYSTGVEVYLVRTPEEDEADRRLCLERRSGAGDHEIPF